MGNSPSTDHKSIAAKQLEYLRSLLSALRPANSFYEKKLGAADINVGIATLEDFSLRCPFTTKEELVADHQANPPYGTNLTFPVEHYTRIHQTSGTTGKPLRWLDTPDDWQWMVDSWKEIFRAASVGKKDRVLFAFSFGPFIGFWLAFDAATQMGCICFPGGGLTTLTRLRILMENEATVLCCTPTYALRLVEVARATGLSDLVHGTVRTVIVAGEPGGSIPATRARLEEGWSARVIDHHGLTEVGPVSFECLNAPGALHLNECEFICEVLDPSSRAPMRDGEAGELVVTNLGRGASPVVRYRTRDIVRITHEPCQCGRTLARVEGGILSRADDMVCIRGVNVYPTAVEAVVRRFPEVTEYRSTVSTHDSLHALGIELELEPGTADQATVSARVAQALKEAMGLSVPVRVVATNTLPRFELKASRFVVTDSRQG